MGQHRPGRTVVWDEFLANRDERGFARSLVTPDAAPLAVKIMQEGLGSLRGAIGTPEQVLDLCRRYEAVGVDQVIFVLQAGPNRHEHICESLELFAQRVMPAFSRARAARTGQGASGSRRRSSARSRAASPPRQAPPGYVIDEPAELARAARARARSSRPAAWRASARRPGRRARAMARLVRGASDAQLERRFGSDLAQRAIFTGMAQAVRAEIRLRLRGRHRLRAEPPRQRQGPSRWTVRVHDGAATVVPGIGGTPAITFKLSIPDFARLVAEEADPQELLFSGRFGIEGDLALATRVPEMFGAPPQLLGAVRSPAPTAA